MPEAQRADQQSGHDLVADAEQRSTLKHAVAEGDRGRQRNGVTAEQRQLHAGLALRDAIAHGWHAAGDLRCGAALAREQPHLVRIASIGLMRGQHVVVGGDDADIHRRPATDGALVLAGGGKPMREIAAMQARPGDAAVALLRDHLEVAAAGRCGTANDAPGDFGKNRVQGHDVYPRVIRESRMPLLPML